MPVPRSGCSTVRMLLSIGVLLPLPSGPGVRRLPVWRSFLCLPLPSLPFSRKSRASRLLRLSRLRAERRGRRSRPGRSIRGSRQPAGCRAALDTAPHPLRPTAPTTPDRPLRPHFEGRAANREGVEVDDPAQRGGGVGFLFDCRLPGMEKEDGAVQGDASDGGLFVLQVGSQPLDGQQPGRHPQFESRRRIPVAGCQTFDFERPDNRLLADQRPGSTSRAIRPQSTSVSIRSTSRICAMSIRRGNRSRKPFDGEPHSGRAFETTRSALRTRAFCTAGT